MGNLRVRIAMLTSCLLASSMVTFLFYLLASANKQYSSIDIYLGSIWTFVLATIISSPLLIPLVRKKLSYITGNPALHGPPNVTIHVADSNAKFKSIIGMSSERRE